MKVEPGKWSARDLDEIKKDLIARYVDKLSIDPESAREMAEIAVRAMANAVIVSPTPA